MHVFDLDGMTATERHRGRHRAKKDTRRWCGGKPGKPHSLDVRLARIAMDFSKHCTLTHPRDLFAAEIAPGLWWQCWEQRYCTACGKMFGYLRPIECTEWARCFENGRVHLPASLKGGITQAQVDAYYGDPTPIVWVPDAD